MDDAQTRALQLTPAQPSRRSSFWQPHRKRKARTLRSKSQGGLCSLGVVAHGLDEREHVVPAPAVQACSEKSMSESMSGAPQSPGSRALPSPNTTPHSTVMDECPLLMDLRTLPNQLPQLVTHYTRLTRHVVAQLVDELVHLKGGGQRLNEARGLDGACMCGVRMRGWVGVFCRGQRPWMHTHGDGGWGIGAHPCPGGPWIHTRASMLGVPSA